MVGNSLPELVHLEHRSHRTRVADAEGVLANAQEALDRVYWERFCENIRVAKVLWHALDELEVPTETIRLRGDIRRTTGWEVTRRYPTRRQGAKRVINKPSQPVILRDTMDDDFDLLRVNGGDIVFGFPAALTAFNGLISEHGIALPVDFIPEREISQTSVNYAADSVPVRFAEYLERIK